MQFGKRLSLFLMACSFLGAQQLAEDPVMKARSQRAQAQGINEADLPPVPRAITDPPPLPPPETHIKDSRGGRVAKTHGRSRGKAGRAAQAGRAGRVGRVGRVAQAGKHSRRAHKRGAKG